MPIHRREYEELLRDYQVQTRKHVSEEPKTFLTYNEGGLQRDEFSYFPRTHYRKAIEGYEELLNGEVFDELTDELVESLESEMESMPEHR
ncbi:MAG: hypothetical protein U5J64_07930 [Halobacteriales archaeon]|nr:hypothetical protein [Halobacteriales archaeon]